MITAKSIYNSEAYKQLKAYAESNKELLKKLVEQFVYAYNHCDHNSNTKFSNMNTIIMSFVWGNTLQGAVYWSNIHHGRRIHDLLH